MALWEGITEVFEGSLLSNVLVGAVVLAVAPVVLPAAMAGIRPVVKTAVKGGIYVYDAARGMVAEAGEQMGDLVTEVRAERQNPAAAPPAAGESQA